MSELLGGEREMMFKQVRIVGEEEAKVGAGKVWWRGAESSSRREASRKLFFFEENSLKEFITPSFSPDA